VSEPGPILTQLHLVTSDLIRERGLEVSHDRPAKTLIRPHSHHIRWVDHMRTNRGRIDHDANDRTKCVCQRGAVAVHPSSLARRRDFIK
jgi:hypothetical protein